MSPRTPVLGERVELARHSLNGEERVIYASESTASCASETCRSPAGRAYLVERGLEEDGYAALPRARVTAWFKLLSLLECAQQMIGSGEPQLAALDPLLAIGAVSPAALDADTVGDAN